MTSTAKSPLGSLNPVAQVTVDLAVQVDEEFSKVDEKTLLVLDYALDQRDAVSGYIGLLNTSHDLSHDLNIVLKSPFTSSEGYAAALGRDLVEGLKEQEDEFHKVFGAYPQFSKDTLKAEPIEHKLFAMCEALAMQVSSAYDHVTLVLIPETAFAGKFGDWLTRVAPYWVSDKVQIMTTECAEHPSLGKLPDAYAERTHRLKIDVDMDEVMMATFDQAQGEVGAEADYQKEIMNALQGIKKQDYPKARSHSKLAYEIAQENNWHTMQAMALIYYGASVPHVEKEQSIKAASQALGILKGVDPEADPSVPPLKYQTLMMRAQAYLTHKEYAEAAPSYEEAHEQAIEMKNPLLKLETARMASFCHYKSGDHRSAWSWGEAGLDAAEDMPAEVVPTTTFPFLISHLDEVRLRGRDSDDRSHKLNTYMTAKMGEGWRAQIKEMVAV